MPTRFILEAAILDAGVVAEEVVAKPQVPNTETLVS